MSKAIAKNQRSRITKTQRQVVLGSLERGLSIARAADRAKVPRAALFREMRRAQDESIPKVKGEFGRECWAMIAEFELKAIDMAVGRIKPQARTLRYVFAHIANMVETGGWELPPEHEENVRKWSAYIEVQEMTDDANL